ncbi:unnamed protein product [Camellia sinensis]
MVRNLLLTGSLFCGPLLVTFCFLNTVVIFYNATAALPFVTIVVIVFIWTFVTSPLLVLGGIAGKNSTAEFQASVRTTKYPREIPPLPWYRGALPQMAMAGFFPFNAIYIELYYIFTMSGGGGVHVTCSTTNHVNYFVKIEQSPPEVHANAAQTLSDITHNASSTLAAKLSSPSFVARIFDHALEDSISKLGLVHSCSATNHVDYFVKIEQSHPGVHANATETLSAITRNASSTLAAKLSSPRFDI